MDIYTVDNSEQYKVLRESATKVKNIDGDIVTLIEQMQRAIRQYQGVGLAATQVGRKESLFITYIDEKDEVFINPRIVESSIETETHEEGCLSIPGLYGKVTRPATVTVEALNMSGKLFTVTVEGLMAVCIQHELDHLSGKLFIDYLPKRQRARLFAKLGISEP